MVVDELPVFAGGGRGELASSEFSKSAATSTREGFFARGREGRVAISVALRGRRCVRCVELRRWRKDVVSRLT